MDEIIYQADSVFVHRNTKGQYSLTITSVAIAFNDLEKLKNFKFNTIYFALADSGDTEKFLESLDTSELREFILTSDKKFRLTDRIAKSIHSINSINLSVNIDYEKFDFTCLPNLHYVALNKFNKKNTSYLQCKNIRRLYLGSYNESDLRLLANSKVEQLWLCNSKLVSLAGITQIPELRSLRLEKTKQLLDWDEILQCTKLTRLRVDNFGHKDNWDWLAQKKDWDYLWFDVIDSFKVLANIETLNTLCAIKVLDKDWSPVHKNPRLMAEYQRFDQLDGDDKRAESAAMW
ncbi:hypothetical protein [Chitinilyticum litopenaei]|uniref:hypothetical protein n=1 Tax=Chitinilyticum litopenaei TaxID=1121276 RepID=UPI00048BCA4C|nr:hypothetical protein [Chitinilyticum litopenaei]